VGFLLLRWWIDLDTVDKWKMTYKWEWNNATKITLISVVIGIVFGIVFILLMKFLKKAI